MKLAYRVGLIAWVLLPFSAGVAAQAPSASSTPDKSADEKSMKPLTVVGCIQPGAQPNQFVLAASADPLAKGVAVAAKGTVPNVVYQLSGGSNLAAHVGHRVEISGTSTGQAQKAANTDKSVSKTDTAGQPSAKVETKETTAIELRDLRIRSLKMVATDCGAK